MWYFFLMLVSVSLLTGCSDVKEEASNLKARVDQFGPGPNVEDDLSPLF